MSELNDALDRAALDPSDAVDLAAVELGARRRQRRGRTVAGGSAAAALVAAAVVIGALTSSGGVSTVQVGGPHSPRGAPPLPQVQVRAAAQEHADHQLAVEIASVGIPRGIGNEVAGCRETTYGHYLVRSDSHGSSSTSSGVAGTTPVYVCVDTTWNDKSVSTPPAAPRHSFSVLYVATVSSYALYLSGHGRFPRALVDERGSARVPTWFMSLPDRPGLHVAGVTDRSPLPVAPPRQPGDPRYVAAAYIERAALVGLGCPVPTHPIGTTDTDLPATSPHDTAVGDSTCTSISIRRFTSLGAAVRSLHLHFGCNSGTGPPPRAVYVSIVRGDIVLRAGDGLNHFNLRTGRLTYLPTATSEYDAVDGRRLCEGA